MNTQAYDDYLISSAPVLGEDGSLSCSVYNMREYVHTQAVIPAELTAGEPLYTQVIAPY